MTRKTTPPAWKRIRIKKLDLFLAALTAAILLGLMLLDDYAFVALGAVLFLGWLRFFLAPVLMVILRKTNRARARDVNAAFALTAALFVLALFLAGMYAMLTDRAFLAGDKSLRVLLYVSLAAGCGSGALLLAPRQSKSTRLCAWLISDMAAAFPSVVLLLALFRGPLERISYPWNTTAWAAGGILGVVALYLAALWTTRYFHLRLFRRMTAARPGGGSGPERGS